MRVGTSRFGPQNGVRRLPQASKNRSRSASATVGSARGRREASGARSEIPTFRFRRFFASFGTPDFRRNRPKKVSGLYLEHNFSTFWSFLRLGSFQEGPGTDFCLPGALPDRFCNTFLPVPPGSCRGLSGSAEMLPGCTTDLRNSLCGVPPGVRRSREAI